MMRVDAWLADAGLSKYSAAFAGMDEQSFLELMMQVWLHPLCLHAMCDLMPGVVSRRISPAQDFGKYGVVDQMDKHKLYRAIKQARVQEQQLSAGLGQYEISGNSGGDLLDLDAHDGDLIEVRCVCWLQLPQPNMPVKTGSVLLPSLLLLCCCYTKAWGVLACFVAAGALPALPSLSSS